MRRAAEAAAGSMPGSSKPRRGGGHDDARCVRQRLAAEGVELEAARATVRVKLEREAQLRVFVEAKVHEAAAAQDALRRQLEEVNICREYDLKCRPQLQSILRAEAQKGSSYSLI